jgi:hypothetical protein
VRLLPPGELVREAVKELRPSWPVPNQRALDGGFSACGVLLTMAVMYAALDLLIDILYGLIDPRVKIEA